MKNVITAVIVASFALGMSSGVKATSCDDIAKAVVDQYVVAANFSTETPEQKEGYAGLVAAHKATCLSGVAVRNKGMGPEAVAKIIQTSARGSTGETINQIISRSMTVTSYTQGYAFGE